MAKKNIKETNGRFVDLSPEIENDEDLLGEKVVRRIKNLRKRNKNVDLSVYKVKVNYEE